MAVSVVSTLGYCRGIFTAVQISLNRIGVRQQNDASVWRWLCYNVPPTRLFEDGIR